MLMQTKICSEFLVIHFNNIFHHFINNVMKKFCNLTIYNNEFNININIIYIQFVANNNLLLLTNDSN